MEGVLNLNENEHFNLSEIQFLSAVGNVKFEITKFILIVLSTLCRTGRQIHLRN